MESSSTTPPPAKSSQPLHNFELPQLKWNMLSQSCSKKRSRSMKSPRGRHATSPPNQVAVQEPSAAAKTRRLQSPPQNSPATPLNVSVAKGEASKDALPSREESVNSRGGGEDALRPFRKRSWVWQSGNGNDCTVIESNPVPSKVNSDVALLNNVADPLSVEKGEKKMIKAGEEEGGGVKRSKILIKIPNIKSKKEEAPEMETSKEGALKNGEGGDEVQDHKGKVSRDVDNETKISEFRTRKLVKSKSQKLGEKGSILRLGEKNKGQAAVVKINANKSAVKEGATGGGGEVGDVSGGGKKEKVGYEKKEEGDEGEIKKKVEKVRSGEGLNIISGGKKKVGGLVSGDHKINKGGGGDEKNKAKAAGGCSTNSKVVMKSSGVGDKKEMGGMCNDKMKGGKSGGNYVMSTEKKGKGGDEKAGGTTHVEKKEKKKLSICVSLTKEEIEEDIYALTGSKPARRPKKRSKAVQKNLDAVFPGLWLLSITPETYKG